MANKKINKNRKLEELKVSDLVLVKALRKSEAAENKIAKFFDVYEGPYRINKKFGLLTYFLENMDKTERGKFHFNNLKRSHVPKN